MSTTVTYNGSTLTTVNNQTKVLETSGTWLEDDITLVDVTSGGGGDEQYNEFIARTVTEISGSASKIGAYAVYYYSSLTAASFSLVTAIGSYAFANCHRLSIVSFPNATTIYPNAFSNCSSLTAVSFPNVISVYGTAFSNCKSLTTVDLPNAVTISNGAFSNCYSLTTVNAPLTVYIRPYAFIKCSALSTISFPSASNIGQSAFASCYNLLSLYLMGSSVPVLQNANAFASTPISDYTASTGGVHGSIYVQGSLYNSFLTASNWSLYSARIVSYTE